MNPNHQNNPLHMISQFVFVGAWQVVGYPPQRSRCWKIPQPLSAFDKRCRSRLNTKKSHFKNIDLLIIMIKNRNGKVFYCSSRHLPTDPRILSNRCCFQELDGELPCFCNFFRAAPLFSGQKQVLSSNIIQELGTISTSTSFVLSWGRN
jgi:hypothetical protein